MNVCGACEKIRATPLASSYRGLLRKGITGYLLLLPWVTYDDIGWVTVPVCILTTYAIVGLELIASGIEDPFGYDGDDLPLDEIVETIRRATTYGQES
jgi:putative membrane protein